MEKTEESFHSVKTLLISLRQCPTFLSNPMSVVFKLWEVLFVLTVRVINVNTTFAWTKKTTRLNKTFARNKYKYQQLRPWFGTLWCSHAYSSIKKQCFCLFCKKKADFTIPVQIQTTIFLKNHPNIERDNRDMAGGVENDLNQIKCHSHIINVFW